MLQMNYVKFREDRLLVAGPGRQRRAGRGGQSRRRRARPQGHHPPRKYWVPQK